MIGFGMALAVINIVLASADHNWSAVLGWSAALVAMALVLLKELAAE